MAEHLQTTLVGSPRLDIEAWRFPLGGNAQHDLKYVLVERGLEVRLYDGAVVQTKEPNEDGSYFYWQYASIGLPLGGNLTLERGMWLVNAQGLWIIASDLTMAAIRDRIAQDKGAS